METHLWVKRGLLVTRKAVLDVLSYMKGKDIISSQLPLVEGQWGVGVGKDTTVAHSLLGHVLKNGER